MNQVNSSLPPITMKSDISIVWVDKTKLLLSELEKLLKTFGDLLPDPLSSRIDLSSYAEKIREKAEIALAYNNKRVVGFLVMYANDLVSRKAYIPIISILNDFQGRGIGKVLLSRAVALARQKKMHELWLKVDQENHIAQHVYSELRFVKIAIDNTKVVMSRNLSLNSLLLDPQITPLESGHTLAAMLGLDIDLWIKRDDLYPIAGGGIKARKIGYIIKKAIEDGHDVIVTNGGPQSNHARSAAILAANLGIKCHLVIVLEPGQNYIHSGNILLMKLSGATIEYTTKDLLALRMDEAVSRFSQMGHNPLYIWGGGHCFQGTVAFVDAAVEAQQQCGNWKPDYLVMASGTGTTQAGLTIGYANSKTQVIGISVARDTIRGTEVIRECVEEYFFKTGRTMQELTIQFLDNWVCGGYEKYSDELFSSIEKAAKAGYFFDPTYSGKALLGLMSLVQNGRIPKQSKVLLWHTGGLMNLLTAPHFSEESF